MRIREAPRQPQPKRTRSLRQPGEVPPRAPTRVHEAAPTAVPRPRRTTVRRRKSTYGFAISSALPGLRWGDVRISGTRVLSALLLVAMLVLLGWFFIDPSFFVYEAQVQGNALLSAEDLFQASGMNTLSVFFVDRAQVAQRIQQAILGVTAVHVDVQWPNRVAISVREQDVRFVWRNAAEAFLVDGMGQVLMADDGAHPEMLTVNDLDNRPLKPGDKVDRVGLNAVSGLHSLLPEVKAYDYSQTKGVSCVDEHGWRIYFGDDQLLVKKVACMRALLQDIANKRATVEFIDVRFVDGAYFK